MEEEKEEEGTEVGGEWKRGGEGGAGGETNTVSATMGTVDPKVPVKYDCDCSSPT